MSLATSPNDYSRAHIYSNTAAPESTASPPSLTVVGANCSVGLGDVIPIATRFRQYIDAKGLAGKVFVAAKPNWVVMSTQSYEGPDVAAARLPELVGIGAHIIGYCCGSSPEHIKVTAEGLARLRDRTRSAKRRALLKQLRAQTVSPSPRTGCRILDVVALRFAGQCLRNREPRNLLLIFGLGINRQETRRPGYYYRADYPKLDDEWHCFTGSQYDAKTREWKMSKLPVHASCRASSYCDPDRHATGFSREGAAAVHGQGRPAAASMKGTSASVSSASFPV